MNVGNVTKHGNKDETANKDMKSVEDGLVHDRSKMI